MSHILPDLFKTQVSATGKESLRIWKVWVEENESFKSYGLVSGKKIVTNRKFGGKNIGKSNETTPEEQAILEANRDWIKQLDKGYKPSTDDTEGMKLYQSATRIKKTEGGVNRKASESLGKTQVTSKVPSKTKNLAVHEAFQEIRPMLCGKYEETSSCFKYITFPCTVQPKLDGQRALARLVNGKVVLTTRTGKQYPWFEDMRRELKSLLEKLEDDTILDGEIYAERIVVDGKPAPDVARFSLIQGSCGLSRSNPSEVESQLEFHLFDVFTFATLDTPWLKRMDIIKKISALLSKTSRIRVVRNVSCKTREDVMRLHNEIFSLGYEGIILRANTGIYKPGKRSLEIRKYKNFDDSEFEIIGYELDNGVSSHYFVWEMQTPNGTFTAPQNGTQEQNKQRWKERKTFIGKYATVKYQGFTEYGLPRFPKVLGVRDDIDFS